VQYSAMCYPDGGIVDDLLVYRFEDHFMLVVNDANLDKVYDSASEIRLEAWSVELYRDNQLISTVSTAADGTYRFTGLLPNQGTSAVYELRFRAPDAGPQTAALGSGDSPFSNGPQRISAITVGSGGNLQDLNLPLWPNGTLYNSVSRVPVAGVRLSMLNAASGAPLPAGCFDDPVQQNQVTTLNGFYKFDLNFSDAACPSGGAYLIEATAPASGYRAMPSQIIPPASDAATAPFSVPACPGSAVDAIPATAEYCEAVTSATAPPPSIPPRTAGTVYYLHLLLSNGMVPGQSQIFNNPIPVDPALDGAVAISKTAGLLNVSRGALVPYTITVTNVFGAPLYDVGIIDRFPAGFKYVAGSARLEGKPAEPQVIGRELRWDGLELQVNTRYTLQFLLVVGSGVSEGEYVNRALVRNTVNGAADHMGPFRLRRILGCNRSGVKGYGEDRSGQYTHCLSPSISRFCAARAAANLGCDCRRPVDNPSANRVAATATRAVRKLQSWRIRRLLQGRARLAFIDAAGPL